MPLSEAVLHLDGQDNESSTLVSKGTSRLRSSENRTRKHAVGKPSHPSPNSYTLTYIKTTNESNRSSSSTAARQPKQPKTCCLSAAKGRGTLITNSQPIQQAARCVLPRRTRACHGGCFRKAACLLNQTESISLVKNVPLSFCKPKLSVGNVFQK